MKLSDDTKCDIQSFVYFLFRGNSDPRLIAHKIDSLDILLKDSQLLYNCFEIFIFDYQTNGKFRDPIIRKETFYHEGKEFIQRYNNPLEVDYILSIISKNFATSKKLVSQALNFNRAQDNLWNDFLKLAKQFCFNDFPIPIKNFDLMDLYNCGTDAVPLFAVWTNVVEVNEFNQATNSEFALKRANERILRFDGIFADFEEWELKQEIY